MDDSSGKTAGKVMVQGIVLRAILLQMAANSRNVDAWLAREREFALSALADREREMPDSESARAYLEGAYEELGSLLWSERESG